MKSRPFMTLALAGFAMEVAGKALDPPRLLDFGFALLVLSVVLSILFREPPLRM